MSEVRTTFRSGGLRRSALIRGAAVGVLFTAFGAYLWITGDAAIGAGVGIIGLAFLAVTGYGAVSTLRSRTVTIDESGLSVTVAGKGAITLAWQDVAAWGIGIAVGRRVFRGSGNQSLLVWPAEHVAAPTSVPARNLWLPSLNCWRVCETLYIDGTEHELEAAMTRYAGDKRRSIEPLN